MKRGTVWVVQESVIPGSNGIPMDYSPAEEFGDVQFISRTDTSRQQNSSINDGVLESMRHMARLYRAGMDYIVLTGSPLAIFMVGVAMAEVGKPAQILLWDRRTSNYRPVTIPVRELQNA